MHNIKKHSYNPFSQKKKFIILNSNLNHHIYPQHPIKLLKQKIISIFEKNQISTSRKETNIW